LSFSAPALAVYKCEFAGKVAYSDAPCRDGKMKELDIAPPLSDPDAAQQRVAQDKEDLQRLESRRKKHEAIEEKQRRRAARAQQARKKKCATLALHSKWADEDAAGANIRSSEKAKRKAQRAAEKYQLECGN
jgi:hypothetical protein